uniref:Uncharacterized protein n=2 Tax=Oryza TaxID=4527 RepID=A0A0D9ZUI3_9ORYZ
MGGGWRSQESPAAPVAVAAGSQPLDKNQQYIMQPRGDKFSNGQKCVVDRIGHTFFHCSMERPISAWITSITAPATTQPLGHFILSYHKEDSLHVCLLSFVWLYMDSIDMLFRGLDHFILIRHGHRTPMHRLN